jgi:ribosomal protein L13E
MTRRPTFETPGRTAENPRSRGFSHSEPAAAGLRQHRTILRVESRRQIFWQVKQKAQRILCVFASIFVTVAGKSASEATLKASAVNCAVLP